MGKKMKQKHDQSGKKIGNRTFDLRKSRILPSNVNCRSKLGHKERALLKGPIILSGLNKAYRTIQAKGWLWANAQPSLGHAKISRRRRADKRMQKEKKSVDRKFPEKKKENKTLKSNGR